LQGPQFMKILFLSRRYWPDIGGVEKHVLEISKILIEKGHEVTVVTQSQGEKKLPAGRQGKINGIKVVRIPKTPKNSSEKLHVWKWFWENHNLIKDSDIIHIHDVYWWYFPSKLLFLSKKSFITFHGYETYPIKKRAILIRKLSELLANGNIIVGDFIKKLYHTTPNYIIYGGVEILNIKNKKLNRNKRESAVFIGRLDEHTGVLDYAKAVELIKKKYPKFDFKIIGDGIYKNRLKKYKPLGFRENSNVFLSQYNIAFVSRYLSILEALASKRLIFALYDNPVKEDYLKMTPFSKFIIIEKTPEKLAEKVNIYLKNPKKFEEMVNKGYEWAKKQTWENVADKYLKIWGNT